MRKDNQGKSKAESVKEESRGLRGNIRAELDSPEPKLSAESVQLAKFHGIYQYDDRDLRRALLKEGQGKAFRFMVRTKNPGGGRISPEQWLVLDRASDLHGDGTLRLTSRQDVQFHGVGKDRLRSLIQLLNSQLLNTYGACGDGVRNVLACPVSGLDPHSVFDGQYWARLISESLAFRSTAYLEIWLDGENVTPVVEEPLYGKAYLPRKFKIALAGKNDNCTDILTNDVALVPVLGEGALSGFQILVGGGLGSSHGNKETYPRLATPLARVSPEQLIPVLEGIVAVFRDYGDRSDRKHARLKYLIEEQGIESFRKQVESRLNDELAHPGEVETGPVKTHVGWQRQKQEGLCFFGLFVENGRVHDRGPRLKTALREIVTRFRPRIVLTPDQNVVLADIQENERENVEFLLRQHEVVLPAEISPLRLRSIACPALPTCGLALTEAERMLPGLIDELQRLGCAGEPISIRVSGCPNSCSRPPVAEIGLIGRSSNGYHIYLGGSPRGDRLAALYRENVNREDLAGVLAPIIRDWMTTREDEEAFGDWCHRVGVAEAGLATVPASPSVRQVVRES